MKALNDDTEIKGRNQNPNSSKVKYAGVTIAVKDGDDVADKTKEALARPRPNSSLIQDSKIVS